MESIHLHYGISSTFRTFSFFTKRRMYFGIVGVFCTLSFYLNIGFGFCVFNSIWEHSLNVSFDNFFRKCSKHVPEVWTRLFIRTMFLRMFGIVGPKWSPYVADFAIPLPPIASRCVPEYSYLYIYINIYIYIYIYIYI